MDRGQWQALMERLSIPHNIDTWDALLRAYSERHRYYHTADHINQCLKLFAEVRDLAERPDEIELAIWFHDAIYKPTAKDNEAKSAAWAGEFLIQNNIDTAMIKRISELIMATVHSAAAVDNDAKLLVDIDLSILGTEAASYDKFESNVRKEYKWVPSPLFRRERRKILQSFLDRDAIYSNHALHRRYEAQARENLRQAISALS